VPIAGFAELSGGRVRLRGLVASPDGGDMVRGERVGAEAEAEALGIRVADDLLARGAGRILRDWYEAT